MSIFGANYFISSIAENIVQLGGRFITAEAIAAVTCRRAEAFGDTKSAAEVWPHRNK